MQPRGSSAAGRPSAGATYPRRGDGRRTPGWRCARRHRLDLPAASCRHPEPRESPASPRAPAPPAELNQEARSRGGRSAAAAGARRRPSACPALGLRRRGARRQSGASDGGKSRGDDSRSASPPPAPGRTRPRTALPSARDRRRAPPGSVPREAAAAAPALPQRLHRRQLPPRRRLDSALRRAPRLSSPRLRSPT